MVGRAAAAGSASSACDHAPDLLLVGAAAAADRGLDLLGRVGRRRRCPPGRRRASRRRAPGRPRRRCGRSRRSRGPRGPRRPGGARRAAPPRARGSPPGGAPRPRPARVAMTPPSSAARRPPAARRRRSRCWRAGVDAEDDHRLRILARARRMPSRPGPRSSQGLRPRRGPGHPADVPPAWDKRTLREGSSAQERSDAEQLATLGAAFGASSSELAHAATTCTRLLPPRSLPPRRGDRARARPPPRPRRDARPHRHRRLPRAQRIAAATTPATTSWPPIALRLRRAHARHRRRWAAPAPTSSAVLMPGTTLAGARACCERLIAELEAARPAQAGFVTVSAGVAAHERRRHAGRPAGRRGRRPGARPRAGRRPRAPCAWTTASSDANPAPHRRGRGAGRRAERARPLHRRALRGRRRAGRARRRRPGPRRRRDGAHGDGRAAARHRQGRRSPTRSSTSPATLDDEEWALMREHPVIGERILRAIPGMGAVARIVRHEHERFDGSGYPDGLVGRRDPDRQPHHPGLRRLPRDDHGPALPLGDVPPGRRRGAHRCAGTQFDPQVIEALIGYLYWQTRASAPPPRAERAARTSLRAVGEQIDVRGRGPPRRARGRGSRASRASCCGCLIADGVHARRAAHGSRGGPAHLPAWPSAIVAAGARCTADELSAEDRAADRRRPEHAPLHGPPDAGARGAGASTTPTRSWPASRSSSPGWGSARGAAGRHARAGPRAGTGRGGHAGRR